MPSLQIPDVVLSASNFGRVLEFTKNTIVGLKLPGVPDLSVTINKIEWHDPETVSPPYITVVPRPEIVDWTKGTNERDDVGYSVQVSMIFANGRDVSGYMMGTQLLWRQMIRKAFHNKSAATLTDLVLDTGESFNYCYVESGEVYLEPAKRLGYDAQYLVLRFVTREGRS